MKNLQDLALSTQFNQTQLVIDCPNSQKARSLLIAFEPYFAVWAKRMDKIETVLKSPDGNIVIPASIAKTEMDMETMPEIIKNKRSLFVGVLELTPALVPSINYILENPEKKLALTRIIDNAQLMLSASSAKAMKSSGTEAVTRKTSDFWLASDLANLQEMYRNYGGTSFET